MLARTKDVFISENAPSVLSTSLWWSDEVTVRIYEKGVTLCMDTISVSTSLMGMAWSQSFVNPC